MQINGNSSINDYYALLMQQRGQQASKASPGAEALAGAEEGGDFSSILSRLGGGESAQGAVGATQSPPPPPPQQAGGGESASGAGGSSTYSSIRGDTDGELSMEELMALLEEEQSEEAGRPRGGPPPRGEPSQGESGSSYVSEWSASLNYANFLNDGASAGGSTSESLGFMRDKIRAAYGA